MHFNSKALMAVPLMAIGIAGIAGCSKTASPSPSPSPSSSHTKSASPSPSSTRAACTEAAIQAAVPKTVGTVKTFKCGDAGIEYWAGGIGDAAGAAMVFFLKADGSKWVSVPPAEICGTASAGLPPEVLAFCKDFPQ